MSVRGGAPRDRERFPILEEQIGEDPARFLDCDLLDEDDDRLELVAARIRGIRFTKVIRAWIAVERNLGRGHDDRPRDLVIDLLEQREAAIEDSKWGDVPIEEQPRREIDEDAIEKEPSTWIIDGERHTGRPTSASSKLRRIRSDGGD